MEKIGMIKNYCVCLLNKETAECYAADIAALANQIPLVDYTEKEILAESKFDRSFYGKWEHSLVVLDNEKPIAVIIGYERRGEDNDLFSENSIYVSELAVHENYQRHGLARKLIKLFLDHNNKFLHLKGEINYTVQTNIADWNEHVRNLYEEFGFREVGVKWYDNRTDVVLNLKVG